MTKQAMARRLTDAGNDPRAQFEADSRIGAAKEESSIRAALQARNFITRLNALAANSASGYVTITWRDGLVGCSLANGAHQGVAGGKPSITAAIDWALVDLGGEVGF